MIARAYSCWLYDLTALVFTMGQYAVMIMVLILFLPCSNIHEQQPRFLNYRPIAVALHVNFSTAMIAVPLL